MLDCCFKELWFILDTTLMVICFENNSQMEICTPIELVLNGNVIQMLAKYGHIERAAVTDYTVTTAMST